MPHFCIYDHPKMPVVVARVDRRPKHNDRDGFRLRYHLELDDVALANAEEVIEALDEQMGNARKAPGVYQAKYDDVREAYGRLIELAMEPDIDLGGLRALALIAGVGLTIVMCTVLPLATILWLVICAFKTQSGLMTMAESAVVWQMFDWRPTIYKLFHYYKEGQWPK